MPQGSIACLFTQSNLNPVLLTNLPPAAWLVGVDSGADFILTNNLNPQAVVGDLDSTTLNWSSQDCQVYRFNADKDATDTELALRLCAGYGFSRVNIYNNLQGRFDHALALIGQLELAASLGIKATIISETQQVWLVNGQLSIKAQVGDTLSLLPLDNEVSQVSLTGCQWPLNNARLSRASSLSVSNTVAQPNITVSASGRLTAILTKES